MKRLRPEGLVVVGNSVERTTRLSLENNAKSDHNEIPDLSAATQEPSATSELDYEKRAVVDHLCQTT